MIIAFILLGGLFLIACAIALKYIIITIIEIVKICKGEK